MELKVWVEGIQRVVCGVTETTTCQDVVYALAHATGKTGRFTLIEKWRNSERLLAPSEFPRKILLKWGEYSTDVQFILQRTALEPKPTVKSHTNIINSHGSSSSSSGSPKTSIQGVSPKHEVQSGGVNRDIKKSLTFSGVHAAQSLVANEQNESFGEVGFYGKHKDFHTLPADEFIKTNNRLPYQPRPLVPPSYEMVKGNPPFPIPIQQAVAPIHYKSGSAIKTNEMNANPVRVPPPYSRASQFSKVRLASPMMNNSPRGLPPYRDPPPPPVPSHPTLLKLSNQTVPQRIPYQASVGSTDASPEYRTHVQKNNISHTKSKSQNEVQDFNVVYNTPYNNFNSESISSSCHTAKMKMGSSSSLRKSENSPLSSINLSSGSEYCQPLPESFIPKNSAKSPNSAELVAKKVKLAKVVAGDSRHLENTNVHEKYESSSKINGYPEDHVSDEKVPGDINDNILMSESIIANRQQNGKDDDYQMKELFQQLARREVIGHNNSLDCRIEKVVVDSYYKSLVKLVNMQRKKLNSQQIDLTKHEAEIAYLDGRWKENESRLNYLQSEIQQMEQMKQPDVDSESIESLEKVLENAQNSEKSMKKLLAELQENYTSCMNSLAQISYKASSLEKQLNVELEARKKFMEIENEEEELAILREIEKLQKAVLQANNQVQNSEDMSKLLSDEISELENMLDVKRNEIDVLRQAMKEANLEALTMTLPDESKQSPEGTWKSGTSRVIKGSPRQLETAVPTSKNPHGVWV